ncbi:Hypothetical protein SMAX5B_000190 [Scophthalmus maximus]|uniref:Uncharacterized protein n=1 Tax=Scophthalmus maximus TaxID=52904 RepID=A0A2U9CUQ9_SCOMX|nr:Hypothetical protein SMAX5B_000190 [Scophthalmus maximus]
MKPMRKCLKPVFSGLTSRGRLHWLQEEAPPPTLHPVDKHPNMAPAGETRGVETEAHKPTGDDDDELLQERGDGRQRGEASRSMVEMRLDTGQSWLAPSPALSTFSDSSSP